MFLNKCSIPSNDSENIAKLLDSFEYRPEKTKEILEKYSNLLSISNLRSF